MFSASFPGTPKAKKRAVPIFLESSQGQRANRYVYAGWVSKHNGISLITEL